MPRPLHLMLALVLAPTLAHAGDPAASAEAAIRCVQARMSDPLVPVTAHPGQVAEIALARCADEIEIAASDLAATGATYRIDAARIAMRRMLLDHALAAAVTAPTPALLDATADVHRVD